MGVKPVSGSPIIAASGQRAGQGDAARLPARTIRAGYRSAAARSRPHHFHLHQLADDGQRQIGMPRSGKGRHSAAVCRERPYLAADADALAHSSMPAACGICWPRTSTLPGRREFACERRTGRFALPDVQPAVSCRATSSAISRSTVRPRGRGGMVQTTAADSRTCLWMSTRMAKTLALGHAG